MKRERSDGHKEMKQVNKTIQIADAGREIRQTGGGACIAVSLQSRFDEDGV